MSEASIDSLTVVSSMVTPATLIMATAMLILSTNARLQAILTRLHELAALRHSDRNHRLVHRHLRRATLAHRALLCLYVGGSLFIVMVLAIGATALGVGSFHLVVEVCALVGCLLLLGGFGHLAAETSIGVSATSEQFRDLVHPARELRSSGDSERPEG